MNKSQFHKELLNRYKKNLASVEEIALLFHLIKTGEIEHLYADPSDLTDIMPEEATQAPVVIPVKRSRATFWKVAASVVIAMTVSLILYNKKENIRDIVNQVRLVRVEAPYGRVRKLQLADGTQVWLNAGSSLTYPERFSGNKRILTLEGEAFFEVAHDPEKPFIIQSRKLNTVVLGTSFNVRTYEDSPAQVSVRSGKVSVAETAGGEPGKAMGKGRTIILTKDQQATYLGLDGFNIRDDVPAGEYMAWHNGELTFTGKTLLEMKPVLERWYGVKILMESKSLANCMMVGSYREEPLKNVLEAMRFALNIVYTIDGKNVMIRGGSCKK